MTRFYTRALAHFPLWPLLLGLLIGVFIGEFFGIAWFLSGSILGLSLALLVRKLPVSMIVTGIMLGHGSHGLMIKHQQTWIDEIASLEEESTPTRIKLTGIILDTGHRKNGPYLLKVTDAAHLPSGVKVILTTKARNQAPLLYGDIIEAEGTLKLIEPLRNPHGFNQALWRHRQGADLTFHVYQVVTPHGVSSPRIPQRIMSQWKTPLREKMTAGLDPDSQNAQLIRAVVLGERPPKPSDMVDDFRLSGTLHVFAVSGLHVGMVGVILVLLFKLTRAPRWLIIILTILGMIIYAGITGLRPPAVRAVIMASVFLSGFLILRRPTLINSLAASAIIVLLADGHQLFTPGFQLSYGVLLAIALLAGFWSKILKPISALDPFMPRLMLTPGQEFRLTKREWIQGALSVSCAAWIGSSPLIWIYFGIITPIAIIAGIPLVLMVFGILALAMLSMALGSLWAPAGEAVNHLNAFLAQATHGTASTFASIPLGHFERSPRREKNGSIIVFDIPGGGGATLLDIGGGILLDSGRFDHFRYHVSPTLEYLNIRPQSLIISHADVKHSGAMKECLASYNSKQALIPRLDSRSPTYRTFIAQAQASHCQLIVPRAGQIFHLDTDDPSCTLEILHAPADLDGTGVSDDSGLVLRLHWNGWTILFTGDAGLITESRLVESGIDLHADVIIMGRNANDFTGHQAFYDAVTPRVIISSNQTFPEHERISPAWRKRIAHQGIHLIDQQQSGAVTLTMKDDKLVFTPMLHSVSSYTLNKK